MPYMTDVHTVIETNAFLRAAKEAGMAEDERDEVVALIAKEPVAAGSCDSRSRELENPAATGL